MTRLVDQLLNDALRDTPGWQHAQQAQQAQQAERVQSQTNVNP